MTTLHGAATFTQGERPRLYKIRRLVRDSADYSVPGSHYEWLRHATSDPTRCEWTNLQMDGWPFANKNAADRLCEQIKVKQRDPLAIFHAVVPA